MRKVRAWLELHDRTQADLAEELDVSEGAISQWLNGTTRPSVDNLIALAEKTGISVNTLIEDLPERAA